MHTGYDNYWMYHNRRHELVLCYSKNDNFSHPVFTDSYKQVQGMGNPSNLCSYIPHPNTVARPHQKDSNDQHRVTSTQSMWPSSICVQPYTSSLTQNFLPNEVCSVQPNNMYDSTQPLQSQVLRNVENCNVNFTPGQNVNYKASTDSVNNHNNYYKAQTARIRVKDISLLNNNKSSNYNSLLSSDFHQGQQKKQHYYPFDSATIRQNKIYNGQTQTDCAKYNSNAMSELNHSYQNFGPSASQKFHLSNEEQYPQSSAAFYQQNAQFGCESQFYYNKVQQESEKSSEDFNKGNYPAPLRKNLNNNVIQEAQECNTQLDLEGHSDNNACASKSNAFSLPGLSESDKMNTTSQTQPAMSQITQTSLLNPIASASKSRTETTANGSLQIPLNGREISTFKITIPSTAQSAIRLNDSIFPELNKNSDLCLPSPNPVSTTLRGSSAHDKVNTQKDVPEISEGSAVFSGSGNTCSGISQLFDQEQPIDGCGMNEENVKHPVENPLGDMRLEICKEPGHNETVTVSQSERALDCSVKPKVENLYAEKENFENGSAVCTEEEAAVQTIKSEVDFFPQNHNTEQLSDPYFFEGTEPSDTENAENIESTILKKPGPKSKTMSVDSNHGQESKMHDVILENTGNCFEEEITIEDAAKVQGNGNEKVALVVGGKCKSEINRDKLDLLIKFLKKDGGPIEIHSLTENSSTSSSSTKPRKEKIQNQNRRKLSKTCVVKNKNTQREMISLVSYKTPKSTSRSSFTKNSLSESSETRNSCGENGPAEASDYLGSKDKSISKEEQLRENNDDPSDRKRQTKNVSGEGKPLKEMTENCSSGGKGITTEERNIINVMRAFQNLKNHFCANCDFSSPAESIWINVVSGELRCLNCFKKMMLKAEENVSNSKKWNVEGVNTLKALDVDKHDVGDERRNKEERSFEKKSKCEGHMPTKDAFKSEDLKEDVVEEVGMRFENTSEDLEKEGTAAVNRITGKEQCDPTARQVSDEQVTPEVKIRRQKARTNSFEEHAFEKLRMGGAKQTLDSQDGCKKRSNSTEEFVPHKVKILEGLAEDVKQNKTIWRDRYAQKSLSKECSGSQKIQTSEEVARKSKKHDTPGRSKVLHSIEGCIEQKSYKTEQSKVKEDEAEHEPKRTGDEVSEKSKGKPMTSDEEVDLKKIATVKEYNKGKPQQVGHSTEKLKIRSESNEDCDKKLIEREKILTEREMEEEKNDWAGNVSKNNESEEKSHSQKRNEEDLNKAAELIDLLSKLKKKSTPSQRKRAKAEALDPTYVPPKRISREGGKPIKMRRKNEELDLRKSYLPKEKKKESKLDCSVWKNDKATNLERKTKHCFQKTPELSDSEKISGKNSHKKLIDKHYRKSKQCLISRLFKGKQNTRVNPSSKLVGREALKMQELGKDQRGQEEKSNETNTEKNRYRSQTRPKSSNRPVESSSDSRKLSGEEPADEKRNWESPTGKEVPAQKSSCPRKRKNKAAKDVFGEIIKDVGGALKSKNLDKEIIYSTALLARLMKKTKKLSWSLLGET